MSIPAIPDGSVAPNRRSGGPVRVQRAARPRGLPDPAPEGARQAAGLPRQRRHHAEAAGRARRAAALLQRATTPTSIAAVHLLSERATQDYEDARVKVQGLPRRRRRRARSSSSAAPPRGSTSSPRRSAEKMSAQATRCSITAMEHHSNIVPWQMLCEEKGATSARGPDQRRRRIAARRVREAADAADADRRRWPTSPTRWARSTRSSGSWKWPTPAACRCWWTAPSRPRTCRSTCASWAAISSSSPATSCTARPAIGVLYGRRDAAGGDAALPGRRRHDPLGVVREDDLQRPAVQVRGGHAEHRRRHRPGGGDRLPPGPRLGGRRRLRRPCCCTTPRSG